MSLRTLFILMGLVTSAMIGGVIYMKVLRDPADAHVSLGEQRAIDRVCDVQCADRAGALDKVAQSAEHLEKLARTCVADCRTELRARYLQSRR